MRLAVKSTVALVALYLLVVLAGGWWLERELRSTAETLIEHTARMIASEVAAAISPSARRQLLQGDPVARQQLEQTVADVTQQSRVVRSVAVVDQTGRVVASDAMEVGRQLAIPETVFRNADGVDVPMSRLLLQGGAYHLFVPLLEDRQLIGYVRLSLNGERIASLYQRVRREFLLFTTAGLAGIGILGFLLHVQISRRSEALTRALEDALQGQTPPLPQDDEFAGVISAARQAGAQLTAAREKSTQAARRLGALIKVMDVGVLLISPDRTIDFANDAARELLGCSEDTALERCWAQIRPLLDDALVVGRAAAAGYRKDIELARAGGVARLRVEVYQLGDVGCEGHLVLVKSREMMDALEHELGLAVQMRGVARFYLAFIHDLKTPLNAMVMNLELLRHTLRASGDAVDERTREKQSRYIEVLREEIARLDRQLRTLLAHAAAPTGSEQKTDLCSLIQEVVALLAPLAKQQRVTLDARVPDAPITFDGNRDRIKQALLNLAMNALEAMPQGGRLGLEVEAAERIRLALQDNGPGIPSEMLPQIYSMHFTTKAGGTGIGLYVAKSVVEAHGGEIRVVSTVGEGTRFEIYLPRAAAHPEGS